MTTADPAAFVRNYVPNPFNLQISGLVILFRARYLRHDADSLANLKDIAATALREARALIKETGEPSPFNPRAREEYTPPELFWETEEFVGHSQRILRPRIGMEARHFRLVRREDEERSKTATTPEEIEPVAYADLIQHHETFWWQVLHVEVQPSFRRQGIATRLYDRMAEVLECEMRPSAWLSEEAYQFWTKRAHFSMDWYRKHDTFGGLWINPKALLNVRWLAGRRMERFLEGVETTTAN